MEYDSFPKTKTPTTEAEMSPPVVSVDDRT